MKVFQQLLKLLVQANQACPRLAGEIFRYNEGKVCNQSITIISGKKAKFGVLIRSLVLLVVSFSMILRIRHLQMNKAYGNLNASEKVYMNLCVITLFNSILNAERYRVRGYFPEKFASFVNSLFVMEDRYFKGKIPIIAIIYFDKISKGLLNRFL